MTFPAETMWTWAVGKGPCSRSATFAQWIPPLAECVIPKAARHYLNQNFYLPDGLFVGNTSLEKVKVILRDSDSPKPHILSVQTSSLLFSAAPYYGSESFIHLWSFVSSTYAVSALRVRRESDQQQTRRERGVKKIQKPTKKPLRPHPNDLITHLSAHCFRPPHALISCSKAFYE